VSQMQPPARSLNQDFRPFERGQIGQAVAQGVNEGALALSLCLRHRMSG
jgi:hypothetical protein